MEVDTGEDSGINAILQIVTSIKTENQQEFWQDVFLLFAKSIRRRIFQIFRNVYTIMPGPYTLKKAGPKMFSFWVINIFAEKQVLFDICGPVKCQQSSYQSE